jgi:hypothetical protein
VSERDQQVALVSWFKRQYPKYKECIIAIPNAQGLAKTKLDALKMFTKLQKEGAKKGASDLFIAVPRGGKHGLWVEMKDVKKTLRDVSQSQLQHLDDMREVGYEAIWCAGFDVAKAAVEVYMNETD